MIRFLFASFFFVLINCLAALGQSTSKQENAVKKFEIRPTSKDYAPERRGDNFQAVHRSRVPTLKSQQLHSVNKKAIKANRSNQRHSKAINAHKNRRIRNK